MIPVRKISELDLSAASGLVHFGAHLIVVADDELYLDVYAADAGERVARVAIDEGLAPLPDGPDRKRNKPDLEALALLPDGHLMAFGSGSTDRRCRGWLADAASVAGGSARCARCDLAPLYAGLAARFPELNIEGAAAAGGRLRLLQRGNGARGENAVIDLDLDGVLRAIARSRALTPDLIVDVRAVDLGALEGVRLGFTDASPIDASGRIAFVAAAEDTDDPYLDGRCAGSVMGVLDADARVEWMEPIAGAFKVEGLAAGAGATWLVADPDDRAQRAPLLAADRFIR